MNCVGIELCDAGFQAARDSADGPVVVGLGPESAEFGWPGIVSEGPGGLSFGPDADAATYVHPRAVNHLFWEKLSHEPSELTRDTVPYSHSQLAYYFLRDFLQRVEKQSGTADRLVLAVPSRYLRDAATEEEKIGLLLGMAGELKLPLGGIVDMACAALGEASARELPRGGHIIHVDVHLHATEISLLRQEERLTRTHYHHLPQVGYFQMLRHLKNTMGNRFLRHTAFDIHEDRRLEQVFYEQTRRFFLSRSRDETEFLYQLNTGHRSYQLPVTRLQLLGDLQSFDLALCQGVSAVARDAGLAPRQCLVSLTDRAARAEGLEARLHEAGFTRVYRLRPGAAALGAALLASERPPVNDLTEVPVESSVSLSPLSAHDVPVEATLLRAGSGDPRPVPSHVIVDGLGHGIGEGELTIGTRHARTQVNLTLPESFDAVGDYIVRLRREGEQVRLDLPGDSGEASTVLAAGDRLALKGAGRMTELLFAYCPPPGRNGHAPVH